MVKPNLFVTEDGSPTLYVEAFDEHYHSIHGALQESNHVFIQAGLEFMASTQKNICLFEMGFGTGLNTLLTLDAANKLKINVDYHTIELYPIDIESIDKLKRFDLFNHHNFLEIHQLETNCTKQITSNFSLTKYHQSLLDFETDIKFDLIYYDAFAPSAQPELWTKNVFEKLYNMMSNNACLVTYCAKGDVKRNLKSVGFKLESLPGPKGKREMTRALKIIE